MFSENRIIPGQAVFSEKNHEILKSRHSKGPSSDPVHLGPRIPYLKVFLLVPSIYDIFLSHLTADTLYMYDAFLLRTSPPRPVEG